MDFCQCLKAHSELCNCKQWQKDAASNRKQPNFKPSHEIVSEKTEFIELPLYKKYHDPINSLHTCMLSVVQKS